MGQKGKVVVVDDDRVTLQCLQDWLSDDGYQVITRDHAIGTLSLIAKERPDVVILDFNMAAISGGKLAELIAEHAHLSAMKVVFYSSEDPSGLTSLMRDHRVLGAIQKTGDEGQFRSEFKRIIGAARP